MSTLIQTFVGNIGIGTNDPGAYKLRVDGAVKASSLEVNGVTNAQVPIGLIAMWYGSVASIPSGWALCNGATHTRSDNGQNIVTPNLTNRFVRGASGDAPSPAVPGQSDGANTVTLAEGNLPAHAHPYTGDSANAPHNHNTNTANAPHAHYTSYANANHAHNVDGNNAPHDHANRYAGGPPGRAHNNAGHTNNQVWAYTHGANAWHGHFAPAQNCPHRHYVQGANAPHNHGINAVNAPHSHTGTVGQTGSGTAVTITNPYYILAYIMKI